MAPTETVTATRPTGSASRRAMVVDIAFARLEVSGRPALRIGTLVESINDPFVVVNGVRRRSREAWAMALADILTGSDPRAVTLAHPTAWGTLRTSLLANALQDAVGDGTIETSTSPRAILIAESHMEPSAQVCVVAECHDGRLDVHRLRRDDGHWAISSTAVFDESVVVRAASGSEDGGAVGELVTDAVEAILVDGDNRDRVAATLRLFEDQTPTGRIAAVERVLLHRYGGARLPAPPGPSAPPDGVGAPRSRARTALVAAGALAVLAVVVVAVVVIAPWRTGAGDETTAAVGTPSDRPEASTVPVSASSAVEVGRVSLTVPAQWRRTGDPIDADGAVPFTAFAARSDDRRIILVQNAVRADSTLDSVAVSLRNRLDQRGTDVVTEFSPVTRYGDRDVIGYRETPVSGGQIRWYVVVGSALQVSVGCQDGGQGQSVDAECAAAVRSVSIAP